MKTNNRIFDFENLAQELNIDTSILEKFIDEAKKEFPEDDMLMELHVIRALKKVNKENLN